MDLYTLNAWICEIFTTILISCFAIFDVIPGGRYIYLTISIILLILKTKGKLEIKFESYYFFNILMIIFVFLSSLWALYPSLSIIMAKRMLEMFICFSCVYIAYSVDEDTVSLMRCFKWSGYIITFYQFQHYGFNRLYQMLMNSERMTNEIGNINMFGAMIAFSCLFDFIEIGRKKKLTISCPLVIPSILIISATQSRKSILIIIIGIVLVFLFYYVDFNNLLNTFISFLILLLICYVGFYLLLNSPLFSGLNNRMTMMINMFLGEGEVGLSAKARSDMIRFGWHYFLENPLGGIGIGNATAIYGSYLHNNYIELLCCGGIIGFVIYYSRYLFLLCSIIRNINICNNKKESIYPCFILLSILLILDYGRVTYYTKPSQIYFVLLFLQIKSIRFTRERIKSSGDSCLKYIY